MLQNKHSHSLTFLYLDIIFFYKVDLLIFTTGRTGFTASKERNI